MKKIIFVFDSDQLLRRSFLVLLIVAYSVIGWGQLIEVGTPEELLDVRDNLSGNYIQTADIDLTQDSVGEGWTPIGSSANRFTGTYDGGGYTISGLYINRPSANYQGLFGYVSGATIENVILLNINITGNNYLGSLAGQIDGATINNSSGCGNISGGMVIGGLIGYCYDNSIINNSFSSSDLQGTNYVGGLLGNMRNSEVYNSYSSGNVIRKVASSNVDFGGFCGRVNRTATGTSLIHYSYSATRIIYRDSTNPTDKGFVGGQTNSPYFSNNYFDTQTSGQNSDGVGSASGRSTGQMTFSDGVDTFNNWDFTNTWDITEGSTYPFLKWQGTYADHNIPQIERGLIYDDNEGKYHKTFTGWDAGELYVEFSPDAQDDGNAEINVTFTTYNLLSPVQEFLVPDNLGAYYSFNFTDRSVFEDGNYFRLQLPNKPEQIWCKIDGSVWNPIDFISVQDEIDFVYDVQVEDISGLSRGDNVTIEFAADKGAGQTLPVELSSFTAMVTTDGQVRLEWRAETETNMLGYDIYRSKKDDLSNAEKTNLAIIPAHNSSDGYDYVFIDENVLPERLYYYWLQSLDLDLTSNFYGPVTVLVEDKAEPGAIIKPEIHTKLNEPYPNPFNPGTYITYSLSERTHVKIAVYNVKGQLIKSVLDQEISKGREHIVYWDGKDEMGNKVGSGVYFAVMKTTDGYRDTVKMILLK